MARYLQIPTEWYETILKIKKAIKRLEQEFVMEIDLKKQIILKNDILSLKEKLDELT